MTKKKSVAQATESETSAAPVKDDRGRAARGDFDSSRDDEWEWEPDRFYAASIRESARTIMAKLDEILVESFPELPADHLASSSLRQGWWTDDAKINMRGERHEQFVALETSYGFCRDAIERSRVTVPGDAWSSLAEATFWHGMLLGMRGVSVESVRSAIAKRMLDARHRENRGSHDQVNKWCASHRHEYRTQALAIEAAMRVVPMKESTLKTWISDWDRGNRSVGL